MQCILCNREPPDDGRLHHEECDAEYDRRVAAGKCVVCGEAESKPHGNFCVKCQGDLRREWRGYPGGP